MATEAWLGELGEFLRIPSISADPAYAGEVRRAGEWVCELLRGAGGEADLVDWHRQPLAVGELRASANPARAPTILCYGHFDVQPPDPIELWESEPFEPQIRGEHLYARGVASGGPAIRRSAGPSFVDHHSPGRAVRRSRAPRRTAPDAQRVCGGQVLGRAGRVVELREAATSNASCFAVSVLLSAEPWHRSGVHLGELIAVRE